MLALAYPEPELSDGIVRIRPWRERDIECVRLASEDPSVRTGTSLPEAFTPQAGLAYVERQWGRLTSGAGMSMAIVGQNTDRAIGQAYVGIRPQDGVVGLGYWVVAAERRQGFASRAATLVSDWLMSFDGVARVEAWVNTTNEPSLRVLANAGFQREGVLRSFLRIGEQRADMVVLSRIP